MRDRRREAWLLAVEGEGGELSGVVNVVEVGDAAEKEDDEEERRRKGSLKAGRR